jgi:hypothetical protein
MLLQARLCAESHNIKSEFRNGADSQMFSLFLLPKRFFSHMCAITLMYTCETSSLGIPFGVKHQIGINEYRSQQVFPALEYRSSSLGPTAIIRPDQGMRLHPQGADSARMFS